VSDLEDLIAKASGDDFWREAGIMPPARTEKNSVEADSFDKMTWAWITDTIPALGKQVEDLGEDFETSPPAYEDLFNLMHKGDPRATHPDLMDKKYLAQAHMMNLIGKSDEIGHLRHETMLDDYNTAFAMLTMRDKMRKAFEDLKDAMDAADEADAALQAALQAAMDALTSGEGQDEAAEALEAALAAYGAAQGDAEGQAEESAASIAGAADMAAEQIQAERAMMTGWGHTPGQLQRMSFEERRALSERLNQSRMAKFAKMIGAQRMSADAERRRSLRKSPHRSQGHKFGRDMANLVPEELNRMAIPEFEEDFFLRFARGRLKTKRWIDPPQMDRGPVIGVCDESYSMTAALDDEGNTREMWSKAVMLSLADHARRGRRDFIYIGFASQSEVWVCEFAAGEPPLEKVIEFTEHFFGGGTHYERPLTLAMSIVEEYAKRNKPKPDIVFVTDDECRVSDEFVEMWKEGRERADVRCFGIQVGGSGQYETMQSLTDRQMSITALNAKAGFDTADMYRSL